MTSESKQPVLSKPLVFKGRGTASNAVGRFEDFKRELDDDGWGSLDLDLPPLRTEVNIDSAKSIISYNQSPDIPFDRSINPYRGCEHGCVYCYARPSHAYLGLSPGLDFESKLFIKPDAAALLRRELAKPGYQCAPIVLGSNTDPYQPIERKHRLTRQILEVLWETRHPVAIITKSGMVERDLDILSQMAQANLAKVAVSVTTLDRHLARTLEPRAAAPQRRIEAIAALAQAGIPTTVMVAPVIPGLNDSELEAILQASAEAGARAAHYILLHLALELVELFENWLQQHVPLKAAHVMSLLKQSHGGKADETAFHSRMRGKGLFADIIAQRFKLAAKRLQLGRSVALDTSQFIPPQNPKKAVPQMSLFD
jgi:DNA repair photolyase